MRTANAGAPAVTLGDLVGRLIDVHSFHSLVVGSASARAASTPHSAAAAAAAAAAVPAACSAGVNLFAGKIIRGALLFEGGVDAAAAAAAAAALPPQRRGSAPAAPVHDPVTAAQDTPVHTHTPHGGKRGPHGRLRHVTWGPPFAWHTDVHAAAPPALCGGGAPGGAQAPRVTFVGNHLGVARLHRRHAAPTAACIGRRLPVDVELGDAVRGASDAPPGARAPAAASRVLRLMEAEAGVEYGRLAEAVEAAAIDQDSYLIAGGAE